MSRVTQEEFNPTRITMPDDICESGSPGTQSVVGTGSNTADAQTTAHSQMPEIDAADLTDDTMPMQEYFSSFVFDEKVTESKQFCRYMKKTTDILDDFVSRLIGVSAKFYDFVGLYFYDGYLREKSAEEYNKLFSRFGELTRLICQRESALRKTNLTPLIEEIILGDTNRGDVRRLLDVMFRDDDEYGRNRIWYIKRLVETALSNNLRLLIAKQEYDDPQTDKGSYVNRTLPSTDGECLYLLSVVINQVSLALSVSADRYGDKSAARQEPEPVQAEEAVPDDSLQKQLDEAKSQLSAARKKEQQDAMLIEKKDAFISQLRQEKSKVAKDAEREKRKLEAKIQDLEDKLDEMQKDVVSPEEIEDGEDSHADVELDMNKRFVFFGDRKDGVPVIEKLKTIFPEARLADSPEKIDIKTTDMVVFLGKYIWHHTPYYKAKEMCRQNNIPYVHCHGTNAEIIVNTIRYLPGYRDGI